MRCVTGIAILLAVLGCAPRAGYEPRDGDIVFHTSRSPQSLAIQLVQAKVEERYGDRVPLDEVGRKLLPAIVALPPSMAVVVSPGAIFDAAELETVYEN